MPKQKVAVLGLGITGSSITATLATRGYAVTAFEQFAPLHERGSSHGDTRIFRRVPHEGPVYVTLAEASYDTWRSWNQLAREELFWECGGIDAGPASSPMVQAAAALCLEHGQPFEMMAGSTFNQRYPSFRLPSEWSVVYQPASGVVCPDATRSFLHQLARDAGARLVHNSRVLQISATSYGVTIRTADEQLQCDTLLVAAGSWLPRLLPELKLSLAPERRVIAWFRFKQLLDSPFRSAPAFVFDTGGGWYGMPTPSGAIKIGHDKHFRESINPDEGLREADERDSALLSECVRAYFTGVSENPSAMKPCIYTNTPDRHFLIDRHPESENILFFSCCSGHGFKYAPAYGEIAARILDGKTWPGLELFRLDREQPAITRFSD